MGLQPVNDQPGLFRETSTGEIINTKACVPATRAWTFEETNHKQVHIDETMIVHGRYVRLRQHRPDARFRIFLDALKTTDWCEISSFSFSDEETMLGKRVARLEAALANDLKIIPFGKLSRNFLVNPRQQLTLEFDRPMTCVVVFEGLVHTGPTF